MATIVSICVGIPRYEKLERFALDLKLTKSEICRRAIDEYLEELAKNKKENDDSLVNEDEIETGLLEDDNFAEANGFHEHRDPIDLDW